MTSSQATAADPLLKAIRQLQNNNPKEDTAVALSTLHKRLQKIAKHPFESKYRIIEDDDQAYIRRIGRLTGANDLLVHAGFVRQPSNSWELKASAEAWPRLMQSTALLSQAVREAEQVAKLPSSAGTGKSGSSRSSLKTAATVSTTGTSSLTDEPLTRPARPQQPQHQAARGPSQVLPRPNNSGHASAPPTSKSLQQAPPSPGGVSLRNCAASMHSAQTSKSHDSTAAQRSSKKSSQPPPQRSEAASSAAAKLKAATLKGSKENTSKEQISSSSTSSQKKGTPKSEPKFEKQETPKTAATPADITERTDLATSNAGKGIEKGHSSHPEQQQQHSQKSAAATSAVAKLKAAALKTDKEKGEEEQKQATSCQKASQQSSPPKALSSSSMMDKFKAAAKKAKERTDKEVQPPKSPPKEQQQPSPSKTASSSSMMQKFKAAALKAKEKANKEQNEQGPEQATPPFSSAQKVAAENALAKFKAAAASAGSQSQARQNPLKLAAHMAADDDDKSVRSEKSSVSLRDLALHNSAANLHNSSSKLKLSGSAIDKFKTAAQHVQAQQQQQAALNNSNSNLRASPGGANKFKMAAQTALMQQRQQQSPVKDPRARLQNVAQMAMMQHQMQRPQTPNADPRARFQNAAQMMMMQNQQQKQAAPMDPRSRFQNVAQMAMMQQRQQQNTNMDPRSRFQNAAQMAALQSNARRSSRMNSNWDGLSYPTSADSDDGLSYPTAGPSDEPARPVRRSRSFDDGRPFMLRTDSGRSLMSASSSNMGNAPPVPTSLGLVSTGPSRRQLNPSASFRSPSSSRNVLNASGSVRNMNPSASVRNLSQQQSMRGGLMIQGGNPSRPQLMRENSMSLRDLQRDPGGVGASSRNMMVVNKAGGVVSATPRDMKSPEQPQEEDKRKRCSSCGFIYTAVNLVTFGELILDLVTTILSFIQLSEEFSCCGNKVDYGVLTLAVTIPYFFLVLVELVMLSYGFFVGGGSDDDSDDKEKGGSGKMGDSDGFDDESTATVSWKCTMGEALSWVLCVNPFLGCLIMWTLMYEVESEADALLILGIEGAAIFLMFVTIYLERNSLSTCTMMVHLVPLVPFTVTCFVVWYYLERGGICFIVKENNFWFDGCELCLDGWPPDDKGLCPDGDDPMQGTYCGEKVEEQFCYYGY